MRGGGLKGFQPPPIKAKTSCSAAGLETFAEGSRSPPPRGFTPMLTRQYPVFIADGSTVISSVAETTMVKCNGQLEQGGVKN